MKQVCCRAAFVFGCILIAGPAPAQVVQESVRPLEAGVGVPVELRVVFKIPPGARAQDPGFSEPPKAPVEIVSQSAKRSGGRVTFICSLRSFETGSFDIPAVQVAYAGPDGQTQSFQSKAVTLEVASVLEPDESVRRLKEIKGPLSPRRRFGYLVAVLCLCAAAAALVTRFLRKKKTDVDEPAHPADPPGEVALRELSGLQAKEYPRRGLINEYFVEVSAIIRKYLEARFGIHAPEMTTEEFLRGTSADSGLSAGHRKLLEDFLHACDLVKFARYAPQHPEIQEVYDAAVRFVEETRELAQP